MGETGVDGGRWTAGNHILARAKEHISLLCVQQTAEYRCWRQSTPSTDGTSGVSRSSVGTQTASVVEWVCPR